MARKSTLHANMKVVRDGLEAFVSRQGKNLILDGLKKIADEIGDEISRGVYDIPKFTGNLQDSIAVTVYDNGRLVHFTAVSETKATKPQRIGASINGGVAESNIWGSWKLAAALDQEVSKQVAGGLYLVIFAAVPYAWYINDVGSKLGNGKGFYEEIVGYGLSEKLRRLIFQKTQSKTLNITSILTLTGKTTANYR